MLQKRLAAEILKCSPKRVVLDTEKLAEIKEAITREDVRQMINTGAITKLQKQGVSKSRHRKKLIQRRKGRRKGPGSKKGKKTANFGKKQAWMNKIRLQRQFLLMLRNKGMIEKATYRDLYLKAKGGFFRSKRHITLYMEEHKLRRSQ